jgi:hypothetical protein
MDSEIKEILDRWRKLERERAEFEARALYWEKMWWRLHETQVKKPGHIALVDEAVHELKKDINEIWFQRLQKAERRGFKWEELCHHFVDVCCERDDFGEYSSLDCGCLEDHINNVLVEYERLNNEEG